MSHRVKLTNQHNSFTVHANETILDAAIRAGVTLNYGCSSGTCGLCLTRMVSGQVEEIKPREFAVSEAQKLQGYVLACVSSPRQDCEIEAITTEQSTDIPEQTIAVKVRKLEQVSREVHRLVVQTPRTKRLRFLAGQYVKLDVQPYGSCDLSIASCPCEDRLIEFHMRITSADPVPQAIVNTLHIGDHLLLHGPYGGFVFQEQLVRPITLFAFDIGFGAIKSLLEHITAQEQDVHIRLIWMACSEGGLYLHNLCRSWTDAFDGFDYTGIILQQSLQELTAQPQQSCQMVEKHLVAAMAIEQDLSSHDIYVCAPAPAVDLFEKICASKNYNRERFFVEPVRGSYDLSCMVMDD